MANERNGLASAAANDHATAEGLPDDAFIFEGEDGNLVGVGEDEEIPSEEEILDGTTTETPEALEQERELDPTEGEVPAVGQPGQKPAAPAAVAPPVTPASPPPAQAPASDTAPPQRVPTFHEYVSANFPAAVDHIVAGGAFRLGPQDAEVIDEAAAPVIERMSARVYLQAVTTMSRMLHEALPAAVNGIVGVRTQAEQSESQFFQEYGFEPAQKEQITNIARFVKFNNPSLSGKPYADEVARMSYAMLGVAPPTKKPAGNGQQKPGVPAQPGQRVVSKKAFTPAAKGGGGQPQNRRPAGSPPPKVDPLADLSKMLSSGVDMDD